MITTSSELTIEEIKHISDLFYDFFTQNVEVTLLAPVVPSIKDQMRVTIICSGL